MVQYLNDHIEVLHKTRQAEVDTRHPRYRKISVRDVATFYGERPKDPRVWFLSPYEFESEWKVVMLKYPQSLRESGKACNHAELTTEGVMKLRMNRENRIDFRLVAGMDYAVKDEGGEDWIAYTDPNTDHFRHTWIITKRKRPVAPIFI